MRWAAPGRMRGRVTSRAGGWNDQGSCAAMSKYAAPVSRTVFRTSDNVSVATLRAHGFQGLLFDWSFKMVIRSTRHNRVRPPRTARHAIRTPDQARRWRHRKNERRIMQQRRSIIQFAAVTREKHANASSRARHPTRRARDDYAQGQMLLRRRGNR